MKKEEVTKWLTIMKANLNSFPEVSNAKKSEALGEAIRLLKNEQSIDKVDCDHTECRNCINHKYCDYEISSSENPNKSENPTSSDDCISRQDVLSEIIRFSTEEGASVECQQLYCDVNNMPPVTPIKPKGHWIGRKKVGFGEWRDVTVLVNLKGCVTDSCECSECGDWLTGSDEYECSARYCPNCGAEMESEVEE